MSDREDGNAVNLLLSQNSRDGEVGGQVAPKIKMRGKEKRLIRIFQIPRTTLLWDEYKKNQNQRSRISRQGCIRGARGKGQVTHRYPHQAHHQRHHLVQSHLQLIFFFFFLSGKDEDKSKPKCKKHNLDEAMFHVQTEEEKHEYNLP